MILYLKMLIEWVNDNAKKSAAILTDFRAPLIIQVTQPDKARVKNCDAAYG